MSTTIDERVVEMRFDNQNFERNVGHTMSTLEKLKQKLNLTGASKGLESINTAAKNVNMNGLGSAVETVSAKFSALQIVGVTALARITNQAMATGERMIKALTIDPVKTGFQEYETQINSVQTILANTSHNGTTIDQVNNALEELNKYADMTIYNFTEMTRNIGTFTAAGVDLDTSVNSIKGIANLAAVSGSTSQQASTAMYQLSQALAAGKVSLMDWNSVVNAGMGGKVFQDALLRTSELLKTGGQEAVKTYGSFRESLTRGEWLTTEVLTETLKQFAGAYSEADLIQQGFSKEQAKAIVEMSKTADDAATKVKTFTQLWDVMKEAAQSGWAQTWKIIVGDYEEAKSLLTPISDFFTGVINSFSDARNKVLESALGQTFKKFTQWGESVKSITAPIEKSAESIGEVVNSVKDYAGIVDEIIGGKWGNGQERWDSLTEAGYDWAHAQNLVNEKLGCGVRHATEYKETQNGVAQTQKKITETDAEYIASLATKSTAQLRDMGLTWGQITSLRELAKQSEKTGIPLEDLIENIDLLNGRTMMINAFKNVGQSVVNVFKAMKTAWDDVFPPKSTTEKAQKLYDLIAAFHKFSTYLKLTDDETGKFNETGQKLVRIFKGIFAIVDVVTTILGGGLKIAFKLLTSVLKYFDMDLLDLLANVGDAAVKFRDWVDQLINFDDIVAKIIPMVAQGARAVGKWAAALRDLPVVQNTLSAIREAFSRLASIDLSKISLKGIFEGVREAFETLKGDEYASIGEWIWDGLILGLVRGSKEVIATIAETASNLIDKFKEILDIHSPSKVFIAIGGFIISGLIIGIKEGIISVPGALGEIVDAMIETIKSIDLGAIMAVVFGAGLLKVMNTIAGAIENFSAPFAGVGDILSNTAEVVKKFGKQFTGLTKALKFNVQMKAIKQLAVAIAILAGTVLAIAFLDKKYELDMWGAVDVVAALAAVAVGLAVAVQLLSNSSVDISREGVKVTGMSTSLLAIAAAIGVLALVVKLVSTIPLPQAIGGFAGLIVIMGLILGFIAVCQLVTKGGVDENIGKLAGLMFKMGFAMLLMVGVCKLAGMLDWGDIVKGGAFMTGFLIFMGLLADVTRGNEGAMSKLGGMMVKLTISLGLMILVCKLVSKLDPVEAIAGWIFAMAFSLFVKSLVKGLTIYRREKIAEVGKIVLAVTAAMLLMVGVCKLVGKLSAGDLVKGALFAAGFVAMVYALVQITKIASDQQIAKVSGTILAMAAAIGILAVVCMILSVMDWESLAKGTIFVGFLSLFMMGMIRALKGAQNVYKSIIVMAVAIGVLALAVGLLSLIDPKKLVAPTIAMGILMGMFSLILQSSKKVTKSMGTLIVLTVAIGLMGIIVGVLGKLPLTNALEKAAGVGVLMAAMAGVLYIISKTNVKAKDALKCMGLLLAMTVPMMAFVAMLHFMPDITTANAKVLTLVGTMTAMTALLAALSFIGKMGMSALKGVGLLTLMAVPMMAFVAVLHFMPDINVAKETVLMLVQVMAVMTVLLGALSLIGNLWTGAIAGVIGLAAMAGLMWIFIQVIGSMNGIEIAKDNVLLVTQVMVTMTILLAVLTIVGIAVPAAAAGVIALTVMLGLLVAMMLIFSWMPDLSGAVGSINIVMNVITAMVNMLATLASIGSMMLDVANAIDTLADTIIKVTVFAGALALLNECIPDFQNFLQNGLDLMIMVAGGIGQMIGAFVEALFTSISDTLPVLADSLSQFMIKLQPFLMLARNVDDSVLEGVGKIVGCILALTAADFIQGLVDGKDGVSSLPQLGTDLSNFMKNAQGFLTGIENVDETKVAAAERLASIILTLTGASILEALVSWKGEVSFESLGTKLTDFAKAVTGFSKAIDEGGGINTEAVETATKAGEMIVALNKAMPASGGLLQKIVGEKDLSAFAESAKAFCDAMIAVSAKLTDGDGKSKLNKKAIESVASAGELFAALQGQLCREGGVLDNIIGTKSLGEFGNSAAAFGAAMLEFSDTMNGKTISEDAVKQATAAGELFLALKGKLVQEDNAGIFDKLMGSDDLGKFGESAKAFGEAMASFSGTNKISEEDVNAATNAGSMMIALQDSIPEKEWFSGKMDLEDFGKQIVKFGEKLVDYSDEISEMDSAKVSSSITSAEKLVGLAEDVSNMDEVNTSNFKVNKIGEKMHAYYEEVSGIDAVQVATSVNSAMTLADLIEMLSGLDPSSINNFNILSIGNKLSLYNAAIASIDTGNINKSVKSANNLADFIRSLVGLSTTGVSAFKAAIDTLGTVSLDNVAAAFSGENIGKIEGVGKKLSNAISNGMKISKGSITSAANELVSAAIKLLTSKLNAFKNIGVKLMTNLVSGIKSQKSKVSSGLKDSITAAVSSARNRYMNFYSAGSYLVDGFAAGISDNSYKAAAKARAMAEAAYEAAKEKLKINSPSKIFRALALSVPEGFAMGIDRGGDMVTDSAVSMSDTAINSVRDSISRMYDVISGNADMQPTIRPVLDLSNVESGASSIASMFGSGYSLGASANFGEVSAMMAGYGQNGGNSDVVSAIDKLRKDIGNIGGTTYNVNGVTYDDGSNVANAVASLTRAAKIERRI